MNNAIPRKSEKVVFTLTPSPIRRGFAVAGIAILAILLAYLAIAHPAPPMTTTLLGGGTLMSLFFVLRMIVATSGALQLTKSGLYDSKGILVVAVANVHQVELGIFAFKPSNGFVIFLKEPMSAAWSPGMWWRFGRRVGIGGVTSRAQGKLLAEALSILVRENLQTAD